MGCAQIKSKEINHKKKRSKTMENYISESMKRLKVKVITMNRSSDLKTIQEVRSYLEVSYNQDYNI